MPTGPVHLYGHRTCCGAAPLTRACAWHRFGNARTLRTLRRLLAALLPAEAEDLEPEGAAPDTRPCQALIMSRSPKIPILCGDLYVSA